MKVYTSSFCPVCFKLKSYLKDHNIAFQEINVRQDPEAKALLVEKNLRTVPVVEVDGHFISGFTPVNIAEVLEAAI